MADAVQDETGLSPITGHAVSPGSNKRILQSEGPGLSAITGHAVSPGSNKRILQSEEDCSSAQLSNDSKEKCQPSQQAEDSELEVIESEEEEEEEEITIIEISDTEIKDEPEEPDSVKGEHYVDFDPTQLGVIVTEAELPEDLLGKPVYGIYKCKFCPQKLHSKTRLVAHIERHINNGAIRKCRFCDFFSAVTQTLREHEWKHTKEKPYQCDMCNFCCRLKGDLGRHQLVHTSYKRYQCRVCGHRTKTSGNLKKHMERHEPDLPRKFSCAVCGFAFKRDSALKSHMNRRHNDTKPFSCEHCQFRCKTMWELNSHKAKHSNDHPYHCTWPDCAKTFKTKSDCTKHIKRHSGIKNYVCSICGKTFFNSTLLRKHAPAHSEVRNFECGECLKKFKTLRALQTHIVIHQLIKPFQCDICYKTFGSQFNLVTHKRVHGGGRPYQCPVCMHGSREMDHLMAHVGSEHLHNFTYLCGICRKPFGKSFQLQLHMQRCHKEEMEGQEEALVYDPDYLGLDLQPEPSGVFDPSLFAKYLASETLKALGNKKTAGNVCFMKQEPGLNRTSDDSGISTGSSSSLDNSSDLPKSLKLPPVVQVARYGGIPFCLARKNSGIQLNCQKKGKKPNRWFMDASLMTKEDAERYNEYLRKKESGLLHQHHRRKKVKKLKKSTDKVKPWQYKSSTAKSKLKSNTSRPKGHKKYRMTVAMGIEKADIDKGGACHLAQNLKKRSKRRSSGTENREMPQRTSSRFTKMTKGVVKKSSSNFPKKCLPVKKSVDSSDLDSVGTLFSTPASMPQYAGSKAAIRRQNQQMAKRNSSKKSSKSSKTLTKKVTESNNTGQPRLQKKKSLPSVHLAEHVTLTEEPVELAVSPAAGSQYCATVAAANTRCWQNAVCSLTTRRNASLLQQGCCSGDLKEEEFFTTGVHIGESLHNNGEEVQSATGVEMLQVFGSLKEPHFSEPENSKIGTQCVMNRKYLDNFSAVHSSLAETDVAAEYPQLVVISQNFPDPSACAQVSVGDDCLPTILTTVSTEHTQGIESKNEEIEGRKDLLQVQETVEVYKWQKQCIEVKPSEQSETVPQQVSDDPAGQKDNSAFVFTTDTEGSYTNDAEHIELSEQWEKKKEMGYGGQLPSENQSSEENLQEGGIFPVQSAICKSLNKTGTSREDELMNLKNALTIIEIRKLSADSQLSGSKANTRGKSRLLTDVQSAAGTACVAGGATLADSHSFQGNLNASEDYLLAETLISANSCKVKNSDNNLETPLPDSQCMPLLPQNSHKRERKASLENSIDVVPGSSECLPAISSAQSAHSNMLLQISNIRSVYNFCKCLHVLVSDVSTDSLDSLHKFGVHKVSFGVSPASAQHKVQHLSKRKYGKNNKHSVFKKTSGMLPNSAELKQKAKQGNKTECRGKKPIEPVVSYAPTSAPSTPGISGLLLATAADARHCRSSATALLQSKCNTKRAKTLASKKPRTNKNKQKCIKQRRSKKQLAKKVINHLCEGENGDVISTAMMNNSASLETEKCMTNSFAIKLEFDQTETDEFMFNIGLVNQQSADKEQKYLATAVEASLAPNNLNDSGQESLVLHSSTVAQPKDLIFLNTPPHLPAHNPSLTLHHCSVQDSPDNFASHSPSSGRQHNIASPTPAIDNCVSLAAHTPILKSLHNLAAPNLIADSVDNLTSHNLIIHSQDSLTSHNLITDTRDSLTSHNLIAESQDSLTSHNLITDTQDSLTSHNLIADSQDSLTSHNLITESQDNLTSHNLITESQVNLTSHNLTTESQDNLTSHNLITDTRDSLTSHSLIADSQDSLTSHNLITESQDNLTSHNLITESQDNLTSHNLIIDTRDSLTSHNLITESQVNLTSHNHITESQDNLISHNLITESQDNLKSRYLITESQDNLTPHNLITESQDNLTSHNLITDTQDSLTSHNLIADNQDSLTSHNLITESQVNLTSHNLITESQDNLTSHNLITESQDNLTSHNLITDTRDSLTSHNLIADSQDSLTSHILITESQDNLTSHNLITESQDNLTSHNLIADNQDSLTSHNLITESQDNLTSHNFITDSQDSLISHNLIAESQNSLTSHNLITDNQDSLTSHNLITESQDSLTSHNLITESQDSLTSHNLITESQDSLTSHNLITESQDSLTAHNFIADSQNSLASLIPNPDSQDSMTLDNQTVASAWGINPGSSRLDEAFRNGRASSAGNSNKSKQAFKYVSGSQTLSNAGVILNKQKRREIVSATRPERSSKSSQIFPVDSAKGTGVSSFQTLTEHCEDKAVPSPRDWQSTERRLVISSPDNHADTLLPSAGESQSFPKARPLASRPHSTKVVKTQLRRPKLGTLLQRKSNAKRSASRKQRLLTSHHQLAASSKTGWHIHSKRDSPNLEVSLVEPRTEIAEYHLSVGNADVEARAMETTQQSFNSTGQSMEHSESKQEDTTSEKQCSERLSDMKRQPEETTSTSSNNDNRFFRGMNAGNLITVASRKSFSEEIQTEIKRANLSRSASSATANVIFTQFVSNRNAQDETAGKDSQKEAQNTSPITEFNQEQQSQLLSCSASVSVASVHSETLPRNKARISRKKRRKSKTQKRLEGINILCQEARACGSKKMLLSSRIADAEKTHCLEGTVMIRRQAEPARVRIMSAKKLKTLTTPSAKTIVKKSKNSAFKITRPSGRTSRFVLKGTGRKGMSTKRKRFMYVETDAEDVLDPPRKKRGQHAKPQIILDRSQANLFFEPSQLLSVPGQMDAFSEDASTVLLVQSGVLDNPMVEGEPLFSHSTSQQTAFVLPLQFAKSVSSEETSALLHPFKNEWLELSPSLSADCSVFQPSGSVFQPSGSELSDVKPLLSQLSQVPLLNEPAFAFLAPTQESSLSHLPLEAESGAMESVLSEHLPYEPEPPSSQADAGQLGENGALVSDSYTSWLHMAELGVSDASLQDQSAAFAINPRRSGRLVPKFGKYKMRRKKQRDRTFTTAIKFKQAARRRSVRPKKSRLTEEQIRLAQDSPASDSEARECDPILAVNDDEVGSDLEFVSADYTNIDLSAQREFLENLRVNTFPLRMENGEDLEMNCHGDINLLDIDDPHGKANMDDKSPNINSLLVEESTPGQIENDCIHIANIQESDLCRDADQLQHTAPPTKVDAATWNKELGAEKGVSMQGYPTGTQENWKSERPVTDCKTMRSDRLVSSPRSSHCMSEAALVCCTDNLCNCGERQAETESKQKMPSDQLPGLGELFSIKCETATADPSAIVKDENEVLVSPLLELPAFTVASSCDCGSPNPLEKRTCSLKQEPGVSEISIQQSLTESSLISRAYAPLGTRPDLEDSPSLTIFVKTSDGQRIFLEEANEASSKDVEIQNK